MVQTQTDINNRYTLLGKLGRGAYSTVWRVFDTKKNTHSALKIAKQNHACAQAAVNEIRLLKSLKDKRIIELHDYFQYGSTGEICLVLTESSGNLLDLKRLHRKGLPDTLLQRLMCHTLEGAQYLHQHNIIHTDIKPENILVDHMDALPEMTFHFNFNFNFKLCDLGSACAINWFASPDHAGLAGQVVQTLNYRSIEVILGYTEYNEKIDIWSLACVYFELATGEYLFDPRATTSFTCAQDHVAQIMELVGAPLPVYYLSAKNPHAKEIMESAERVCNIPVLKPWSLAAVFQEKYAYSVVKATLYAAFLIPLLCLDFNTRSSATEGLTKMILLPAPEEEETKHGY